MNILEKMEAALRDYCDTAYTLELHGEHQNALAVLRKYETVKDRVVYAPIPLPIAGLTSAEFSVLEKCGFILPGKAYPSKAAQEGK